MKRSTAVFVTIYSVTSLVCDPILGLDAHGQGRKASQEPNAFVIGGEGLGAVGAGAIVACGTASIAAVGVSLLFPPDPEDPFGFFGPMLVGLAAGYGLGFPLGSAVGASSVGHLADQGGSFWSSWAGAELGAIAAVAISLLGEGHEGFLLLGPPLGAVIGYNLSRPKGAQVVSDSFHTSSVGGGPRLSLFVPEVQLRRDRFAKSYRLDCEVAIATLTF